CSLDYRIKSSKGVDGEVLAILIYFLPSPGVTGLGGPA
ncbi:unnamed protein product, partial [marine sediment metagenome]